MKKVWKWILGILIVLVVITALVAVPLVMHTRLAASAGAPPQNRWNGGPMMRGNPGWQAPDQGFNGQRGPMMGEGHGFNRGFSRGFSPFGFGSMFIGGLLRLIPLALFGLLLFGVYQLGKRSGMRSTVVQTVVQPAPVSAQVEPEPAQANNEPPSI
jgi:hypothetical protein